MRTNYYYYYSNGKKAILAANQVCSKAAMFAVESVILFPFLNSYRIGMPANTYGRIEASPHWSSAQREHITPSNSTPNI